MNKSVRHRLSLFGNKFWFEPVCPAPICLFRILLGLVALSAPLTWWPDADVFFGEPGLISSRTVDAIQHVHRFSLLHWLPGSGGPIILSWVLVAAAFCLTVGFCTRASSIIVFLCLFSFLARNPFAINGGDRILSSCAMVLMFAPCGRMFSVDSWLAARKATAPVDPWQIKEPPWTQRLIQLHMCAVYLHSIFFKLQGYMWWQGTVLYYATRCDAFLRAPIPFLFDHLWTMRIMSWMVILVELSLFTLVWVRKFRYYVLLAGMALHLGIEWVMNVPVIGVVTMACYATFLDADDIKRFFAHARARLISSG